MIPAAYRGLLQDRRTRLLLAGLGASSLGDGLSTVTITALRRLVRNREVARQESRSLRRRAAPRLGPSTTTQSM
jgi:hypothetical protein